MKARAFKSLLPILGAVALLALILSTLPNPMLAFKRLGQIPPWEALLLLILVALSETASTWKWRVLLAQSGREVPRFLDLIRFYWIGMFYGTYVPGSVSGDAARVLLTRRNIGTVSASAAVFMQRNTGLAAMLLLGAGFSVLQPLRLGLFPYPLLDYTATWILAASAGFLAINVLLLAVPLHALLRLVPLPDRLKAKLDTLQPALRAQMRAVPVTVGISFATQLVDFGIVAMLAHSLGLQASFGALVQSTVLVSLAGMLPITINGVGLRELSYSLLLAHGASKESAVATGLAVSTLYLVAALPGGLLHGAKLLKQASRAHPAESATA